MNFNKYGYLFVCTLLISACSKPDEAAKVAGAGSEVVLEVNGEPITAPMLEVFARGRGLDPADPASAQRALDSLTETMLLAQDAKARGLADRPEVQAELELVVLQQLAGRELADLRASNPVSDAEVRAYYEQQRSRTGNVELHLKHILFADEAAAMAAAERAFAPGADFDALMAEYAASGAIQARELDWANLTQLPPELAQAAQGLPDGQVGPLPVQTSYGWHVFRRVASRPFQAPPFEQVEEGARKQLIERKIAEKIRTLRSAAKISSGSAAAE
jgi:peptidyl-prolyl cis-trans isomerase C